MLLSNQRQIIEQAKFTYSTLGRSLEKRLEKQASAIKSLNIFNKKDELKQTESTFPQNSMNDLIFV